ncbi:DOPA 4,5-dioxygenase [Phytophthora megakarya]|uniref:DOPA 4,5-dioxygenase n=1 Tax=Phytophthora megakarya TaxID=4795 RepID=A0A225X228_9STRA|nr:DOPA 4,5-dioxygenase [Phytophthora megakarya]
MSPNSIDQNSIKEWHFHTCFYANNERSKKEAQALRDALVAQVTTNPTHFIAVCNGVTTKELPGLVGKPPPLNLGPVGPHLSGSFETWVPAESFAQVLSWFTMNRGSLSILVHPLTRYEREDHTTHAMWLGTPWVIDLDPLREDLSTPPLQYPELGYGYSTKADGQ